jgi:hypothetical protein
VQTELCVVKCCLMLRDGMDGSFYSIFPRRLSGEANFSLLLFAAEAKIIKGIFTHFAVLPSKARRVLTPKSEHKIKL